MARWSSTSLHRHPLVPPPPSSSSSSTPTVAAAAEARHIVRSDLLTIQPSEEKKLSPLPFLTTLQENMQGLSGSSLVASTSGCSCHPLCLPIGDPRKHGKKLDWSTSFCGRPWLLSRWSASGTLQAGSRASRGRDSKGGIAAAWFFADGKKGEGLPDASSERSESANEDILVFFFQLDLGTRIQYALNLEQYDVAQQLRNKLAEVETEIIKRRETKHGTSPKSKAQDKAIELLRLRADLQKAIDSENYAGAADLRDRISELEGESLAISAKALAYENTQYSFRLGQKVKHKIFGYEAVVCGMDAFCCESSTWMEMANVNKLAQGPNQPFYQVLVDLHTDPNILVAYVPEENLLEHSSQDNKGRFDHPYLSFLFYGMDPAGDFIPIKQLREKFNRPRFEAPMQDEGDD